MHYNICNNDGRIIGSVLNVDSHKEAMKALTSYFIQNNSKNDINDLILVATNKPIVIFTGFQ